jgi:O-antigen/teichoic acid export membrane protein
VFLVLNFGNLELLGRYVAILALAESIRSIGRYFLDALLPSLTNMVAVRDLTAAANVFETHMRILFLVNTGTTCGLILFAGPITALFGSRYTGLAPLVVLLALFIGLSTPGALGGAVLSSIGKQQRAVWITVGQGILFVSLFITLWPRWQLTGGVLAYGLSLFASTVALIVTAKFSSPFRIAIAKDYLAFGLIVAVEAMIALAVHPGLLLGFAALITGTGLFLLLGGYTAQECMRIVEFFAPGSARLRFRVIGQTGNQP